MGQGSGRYVYSLGNRREVELEVSVTRRGEFHFKIQLIVHLFMTNKRVFRLTYILLVYEAEKHFGNFNHRMRDLVLS